MLPHKVIDKHMEYNHISNYRVAEQTGMSQSHVARYRKYGGTEKTMIKIAGALGIPIIVGDVKWEEGNG